MQSVENDEMQEVKEILKSQRELNVQEYNKSTRSILWTRAYLFTSSSHNFRQTQLYISNS